MSNIQQLRFLFKFFFKNLKYFQPFLYRHFKDTLYCKQMPPSSHQPARFSASAKTHKFDNLGDINVNNLKLRPIIDQTGTRYYKTGKVISKYLKPLTNNESVINNTQDFPSALNNVPISEMKKMLVITMSRYSQISLSKTR